MQRTPIVAGLILPLVAGTAAAGERTVTLAVENLWCTSCTHIVKRTLAAVPGVSRVEASYRTKAAVVTFDDTKADAAALTAATTSLGFPSRVVKCDG